MTAIAVNRVSQRKFIALAPLTEFTRLGPVAPTVSTETPLHNHNGQRYGAPV